MLPNALSKKLEKSVQEDIAGNYFLKPKRAAELLNQTTRMETGKVFNTWRGELEPRLWNNPNNNIPKGHLHLPEFTKKNKIQNNELFPSNGAITNNSGSPNGLSSSYGGISSLWLNGEETPGRSLLNFFC